MIHVDTSATSINIHDAIGIPVYHWETLTERTIVYFDGMVFSKLLTSMKLKFSDVFDVHDIRIYYLPVGGMIEDRVRVNGTNYREILQSYLSTVTSDSGTQHQSKLGFARHTAQSSANQGSCLRLLR